MTPGDDPVSDHAPLVTNAATLLERDPGTGYQEFLDVPALSLGMFSASAGHVDDQEPHDRHEVYVVLTGEAVLDIAGVPHEVSAGSVAYVPAGVRHRFAEVHADLCVLVFFAGERR